MPTPKDVIRRLVTDLQELEEDRDILSFVLAAMRVTYPEFDARALLQEAREHPRFRDAVQARYKPLLEVLDLADVKELLEKLPPSKYPH